MKVHQPNTSNIHEQQRREGKPSRQRHQLGHRSGNGQVFTDITLEMLLRQIWLGIQKLGIAFKYQFHRLTAGAFSKVNIPWYRLALAAVAVFIITKKDVQFSINMQAPNAGFADSPASAGQMSMAQPVALRQRAETASLHQIDDNRARAYISRFRKVAQAEMDKFGIPASIKMAQGLLESQAGENAHALRANNHFGRITADRPYNSAWENWRAHSLLLRDEFPALFRAGSSYKQWAANMGSTIYSHDSQYAEKLLSLIEQYQLYELDQI